MIALLPSVLLLMFSTVEQSPVKWLNDGHCAEKIASIDRAVLSLNTACTLAPGQRFEVRIEPQLTGGGIGVAQSLEYVSVVTLMGPRGEVEQRTSIPGGCEYVVDSAVEFVAGLAANASRCSGDDDDDDDDDGYETAQLRLSVQGGGQWGVFSIPVFGGGLGLGLELGVFTMQLAGRYAVAHHRLVDSETGRSSERYYYHGVGSVAFCATPFTHARIRLPLCLGAELGTAYTPIDTKIYEANRDIEPEIWGAATYGARLQFRSPRQRLGWTLGLEGWLTRDGCCVHTATVLSDSLDDVDAVRDDHKNPTAGLRLYMEIDFGLVRWKFKRRRRDSNPIDQLAARFQQGTLQQ